MMSMETGSRVFEIRTYITEAGKLVQASLKESKLSEGKRCVFEVKLSRVEP